MIRVLIADDQALVRTGFRVILDAEPDLEVVGEAGDGRETVELVPQKRPDVVLMDIRMPNLDGIEATRRVTALPRAPRVLMLTTFDLDEYVYEALRAGASGFLLKDAGADELLHAVRVVADGEALLSPSITRRLIADYARRPPPSEQPAALAELTPRELEGATPVRARPLERRDLARARARRGDREDPRRPRLPEARPARPGASGRARLRDRARHPRRSRIGGAAPFRRRRSSYGRMRMIVFPTTLWVGLRAATASPRVETLPMFVRSRPSRTRWTTSPS